MSFSPFFCPRCYGRDVPLDTKVYQPLDETKPTKGRQEIKALFIVQRTILFRDSYFAYSMYIIIAFHHSIG